MKFDSDTEIDRLLRRHARRNVASPARSPHEAARETSSDDDGAATLSAGGTHLDADEMNAYAEGAVPEALRARYLSHLADCDECRGLVTKLTLAANVQTESDERQERAAASPSRSWREWLAALFSPPVLRLAVPALALLAVVVVAFVALRPQRRAELVAQNEQTQPSLERAQVSENEQQNHTATANTATVGPVVGSAGNANSNTAASPTGQPEATKATSTLRKEEAETGQATPAPQNEPKPTPSDFDDAAGKQASDRDEARTMAKQQPTITDMPATKAPREETDKATEEKAARKSEDVTEKNKKPAAAAEPPPPAANDSSINYGVAASKAQSNARRGQERGRRDGTVARARVNNPQLSGGVAGPDAKDERVGETKSVGGRQFRRQGGAWVDTAYSPSRSTINVPRNSEQYRALVADEPGIRTIADQLGGTVIVVWKKQAYRIY